MNPTSAVEESLVADLVSQWQRRRSEGQATTPAELCRDRPELLLELERRIAALERMDDLAAIQHETVTLDTAGSPHTIPGPAAYPEIPGYEILDELGRGGMGVVYKARQTALNRVVALKMILHAEHASSQDRQRFQAEAEAVARLQHPNIVQIHEVGEHHGLPYFSLEFCAGGSLADKLDGTPLPPKEAAILVQTLASAIHAAHGKGILHRDLKPANVLLAEDGTPKITDFGLAKKLGEKGQTQSGANMGTPSYMAPEQAGGKSKEIGPAVDIYALGAILYELLTGRPPFRAASTVDTIMQVLTAEPAAPSRLNPSVPRDLELICLKCLQKQRTDRYLTQRELADDLGRFRRGEPTKARPLGVGVRIWRLCKRHPLPTALLIIGVAIGIALPRFWTTNTSVSALSLSPAQVTVEEWKEAEEVLQTAGVPSPQVYKYAGGDVEFWIEVEFDEDKKHFSLKPLSYLAIGDTDGMVSSGGSISGYFIFAHGNPNDEQQRKEGYEDWSVSIIRSIAAEKTFGMSALFAKAETSQLKKKSTTERQGISWCVWRHMRNNSDFDAVQKLMYLAQPNVLNRLTLPAAWKHIDHESVMMGSISESDHSMISNPIPTNVPVCLKESQRKRGYGKNNDQHTVKIMCKVIPTKGEAAGERPSEK